MTIMVGMVLGPLFAGFLHDLTGSYQQAFMVLAGFSALGSVALILARKPEVPNLYKLSNKIYYSLHKIIIIIFSICTPITRFITNSLLTVYLNYFYNTALIHRFYPWKGRLFLG